MIKRTHELLGSKHAKHLLLAVRRTRTPNDREEGKEKQLSALFSLAIYGAARLR